MGLRIVLDQRDVNDLKQGAALNRAGKFNRCSKCETYLLEWVLFSGVREIIWNSFKRTVFNY